MALYRCGGGGEKDGADFLYMLNTADVGLSYDDFVANIVRYGNFKLLENSNGRVHYQCNAAAQSWYSWWLDKPIDFTNYSKAIITYQYSGYGVGASCGFSQQYSTSTQPTFDIPAVGGGNVNGTFIVDISNYSGNYYFGARGAGSSTSGSTGNNYITAIMFVK